MSDEKTYSEAEVRERERAAFEAGAEWCDNEIILLDDGEAEAEARRRYPITRRVLRVVNLGPARITYNPDTERVDFAAREWGAAVPVKEIRDLLANPFEEISE
jgi:hypothetical protein